MRRSATQTTSTTVTTSTPSSSTSSSVAAPFALTSTKWSRPSWSGVLHFRRSSSSSCGSSTGHGVESTSGAATTGPAKNHLTSPPSPSHSYVNGTITTTTTMMTAIAPSSSSSSCTTSLAAVTASCSATMELDRFLVEELRDQYQTMMELEACEGDYHEQSLTRSRQKLHPLGVSPRRQLPQTTTPASTWVEGIPTTAVALEEEIISGDASSVASSSSSTASTTSATTSSFSSSPYPRQTVATAVAVHNSKDNSLAAWMNRLILRQQTAEDAVRSARFLLLGAAALYGTNFSLVKLLGETEMPIGLSSTLRFGMAALATLPWLIQPCKPPVLTSTAMDVDGDVYENDVEMMQDVTALKPHEGQHPQHTEMTSLSLSSSSNHVPSTTKTYWSSPDWAATMAGLEVGMWVSVGYIAQAVGLETTLASKSAFLCSLAVVIVPLLDYFTGKKLLPREIMGALLALTGVGFLELGGTDISDLTLSAGDIASLMQPLAFGMGFWRMEKAMHRFPNQANRCTAAQLMAVFLSSALYCAITDPHAFTLIDEMQRWLADPMILFSLFWTGCITTALTVYMETVALKTLSAAETTLIFSTEPVFGSLFAAGVMGERFGVASACGAGMILFACLYSNLGIDGMVNAIKAIFTKSTAVCCSNRKSAAMGKGHEDDDDDVRDANHNDDDDNSDNDNDVYFMDEDQAERTFLTAGSSSTRLHHHYHHPSSSSSSTGLKSRINGMVTNIICSPQHLRRQRPSSSSSMLSSSSSSHGQCAAWRR